MDRGALLGQNLKYLPQGTPGQAVGLLSMGLPSPVGDAVGLLGDVYGYARNPSSLTPAAGLLSLAGLIPGVPAGVSKNYAKFGGKPFWSGEIDLRDFKINEVHPYEKAADADFHHSFYFSQPAQIRMRDGESAFFWVDPDGSINVNWRDTFDPKTAEKIKRKIKEQLDAD